MNIYKLLNVVESNQEKKNIIDLFMSDFAEVRNGLKLTTSECRRTMDAYKKAAKHNDENYCVYSDGVSALYDASEKITSGAEPNNIASHVMNVIKNAQRPVEFCFLDSLAFAKMQGWKPGKKMFVNIGGAWFDFDLVYKICKCLNPGTYDFKMTNDKHPILLVKSRTGLNLGIGIVLPINVNGADPVDDDLNIERFFKFAVAIDKEIETENETAPDPIIEKETENEPEPETTTESEPETEIKEEIENEPELEKESETEKEVEEMEEMKKTDNSQFKTGDVVRISGAYFQNDNGLYYIEHSPGDPSWCGSDYCLKKICKNGKISISKYSTAFFPLKSFTNNREKNALANEHNAKNAKMEIVTGINRAEIVQNFQEKAENEKKAAERDAWNFGAENECVKKQHAIADFYASVAARIVSEDGEMEKEEPQKSIRFYHNGIRVDGGNLIRCSYTINKDNVVIYASDYSGSLPREYFAIKNDSDIMTDYYEKDRATVTADHPLYKYVRYAALKGIMTGKTYKTPTAENVAEWENIKDPGHPTQTIIDSILHSETSAEISADTIETTEPEKKEPEAVNASTVKYYDINEQTAKNAHYAMSFRDYKPNRATNEYRASVAAAAKIAEDQKKKVSVFYHGKIDALLDKYARKLAQWTNDYNRNGASCPSVMICGSGNFPTRKKEKQISREKSLWNEYEQIKRILAHIQSVGTGAIDFADPHAKEMFMERIENLKADLEKKKAINAYYRKHNTFIGCSELTPEAAEKLEKEYKDMRARCPWHTKPFPDYELTSIRDKIKRNSERLAELEKRQETQAANDNAPEKFDGGEIIRNIAIDRLQIVFDSIPAADIRESLKNNGFRWSPKNKAWQRQLTPNAERALKNVCLVTA